MNPSLPKISIITTSYNQGAYLEKTIRSVLNQGYPNLEYIIIDGGSSDDSVDTIKKYAQYLAYWVSEKDRGQSDALNKGFAKSTGEILYWLNSDDFLDEDALNQISQTFIHHDADMVMGEVTLIDSTGQIMEVQRNDLFSKLYLFQYWQPFFVPCQPGVFFHRRLLKRKFLVEEKLHYGMDHELWLHLLCNNKQVKVKRIKKNIAFYLFHHESKSQNSNSFQAFMPEWKANVARYFSKLSVLEKIQLQVIFKRYSSSNYWSWFKSRVKSKLAG